MGCATKQHKMIAIACIVVGVLGCSIMEAMFQMKGQECVSGAFGKSSGKTSAKCLEELVAMQTPRIICYVIFPLFSLTGWIMLCGKVGLDTSQDKDDGSSTTIVCATNQQQQNVATGPIPGQGMPTPNYYSNPTPGYGAV